MKSGFIFIRIAAIKSSPAFFRNAVCVHGLDSYRPSPVGDIVTRFADRARSAKLGTGFSSDRALNIKGRMIHRQTAQPLADHALKRRAQSRAVWGKPCRA